MAVWIADDNTARYLPESAVHRLVIGPGEQHKTMDTVLSIVDFALEAGAGRDARFCALGGGVVCDMTAFAASVYMRGVEVVLVPTTLLSMVDASLGGKSGVDYRGFKNIIGAFHPASKIIVSPRFLETLPEAELRNGLAEVIKHAMLSGDAAVERLERQLPAVFDRDPAALSVIIAESLEVKGAVIEQDPLEKGIRAHLNLGHTFGHALESASGFSGWSHGEAVAWGLSRALHAGALLGVTEEPYRERVNSLLERCGYRLTASADPGKILSAIGSDKKKKEGEVRFVLQSRAGETFTRTVPAEVLEKTVAAGCR